MRVLFLTTAHNSLSQRAYVELTDIGHEVKVHLSVDEEAMLLAVEQYQPHLIIAPFLKKMIPEEIWHHYTCLIVHPGIKGDRGPSSLDWAILNGEKEWGVTLLQANQEKDGGDIWSSHSFEVRSVSKSSLYRREVTDMAIKGLLEAVERFEKGSYKPEPLDYSNPDVKGTLHIPMKQIHRKIDWSAPTAVIARKIRSGDSQPGVLDTLDGDEYYLYGAHEEDVLKGEPGEILAWRDGAICRATGDGAIWITHLKRKKKDGLEVKLPAVHVLKEKLRGIPESTLSMEEAYPGRTFREIWYEEKNEVGYLHFDFYNGAMCTNQCIKLKDAFIQARKKKTKIIVLMGGSDFWSNGIHLNVIEAAENPADESWHNINAMNDLILEILNTDNHLVISAMQGNAAAGGLMLALAADRVWAREGIVLNPHYKKMGLYGSEYWTYLLPKRVGMEKAIQLTEACLPVSTRAAFNIGLIDGVFPGSMFCSSITSHAEGLAQNADFENLLIKKGRIRQKEEVKKPLEDYRREELRIMHENFYGPDPSYHLSRKQFVYKM